MKNFLKTTLVLIIILLSIFSINFGKFLKPYANRGIGKIEEEFNNIKNINITKNIKNFFTLKKDNIQLDNEISAIENLQDSPMPELYISDNNGTSQEITIDINNDSELIIEKFNLICELIKLLGDLEMAIITTEDQDVNYLLKEINSLLENTEFEYITNQLYDEFNKYQKNLQNSNSLKRVFPTENFYFDWISSFFKVEILKTDDQEDLSESLINLIREFKEKLSNKNTIRSIINAK